MIATDKTEPISELLTRAFTDPLDAFAEASRRLGDSSPAERCTLLRVMGNACRELRQTDESVEHLGAAVELAIALDDPYLEGTALMSLAATLSYRGEFERSLQLAGRAIDLSDGDDRVVAMSQRAGLLRRAGRHAEALAAFTEALEAASGAHDQTIRGEVWVNRGVLHGLLGDIGAAEADTQRALALFEEMGWTKRTVDMQHNLAWLAGRRGDVVEALRRFDATQIAYEGLGLIGASIFPDRCEVLIAAGLVHEALAVAEHAARGLELHGDHVDLAEALLLVARAALLTGESERAMSASEQASAAFLEQGREGWWAAATSVSLEARLRTGRVEPADRDRALAVVAATKESGLRAASAEAALVAAGLAFALGEWSMCAADLAGIDRRDLGPAARFRLDLVRARLSAALGERDVALDGCAEALREFSEISSALGGTELRAHIALHVEDLVDFGLSLALDAGEPRLVLEWAERQRASALSAPPVRPPAEPELEHDLNVLRSALIELEECAQRGYRSDSVVARCVQSQDRVRRRMRLLSGTSRQGTDIASLDDIADAAHGSWVIYVESRQSLLAIRLAGGEPSVFVLGNAAAIKHQATLLQSSLSLYLGALGRGVLRDPSPLLAAAAELDGQLFSALDISDPRLVICPTGRIYDLPWGLLPTLRSKSFVLAPSITMFRRCRTVEAASVRSLTAIAGPGLRFSDQEAVAVGSIYESSELLIGDAATVDNVKRSLEGADVAHIVCHGRFVSDNPMFSSLMLRDGPMFVHELERIRRPPTIAVLSACHAGLHASPTGREILGLTASLLSSGSRSVVAATVPIPDTVSTIALMTALHALLAGGGSVADALREVRRDDPILAGAFSCHGAE